MIANDLGIPVRVLMGKVPKFKTVHQIYKQLLYTELMRRLHKSYFDRAWSGVDDYGESWDDLKEQTHRIKRELNIEWSGMGKNYKEGSEDSQVWENTEIRNQPHLSQVFKNKRYLSPSQREEYDKSYKLSLSIGRSKSSARRDGLKSVTPEWREDTKTPINIRYGRLVSAFTPGVISNNRIYGGPDQIFQLVGLNFVFSVERIPYVDNVESLGRELITERHLTSIIPEAQEIAIRAARTEYDRILRIEDRDGDREYNPPTRNADR